MWDWKRVERMTGYVFHSYRIHCIDWTDPFIGFHFKEIVDRIIFFLFFLFLRFISSQIENCCGVFILWGVTNSPLKLPPTSKSLDSFDRRLTASDWRCLRRRFRSQHPRDWPQSNPENMPPTSSAYSARRTVQFHNQPISNQQQLLGQLGNRSTCSINRLPNLILALTIWLKADQVLLSFCSYCLTIHLLKWEIWWEFSDDDVDGNNQRRWLIGETAKKEEELRPSTN